MKNYGRRSGDLSYKKIVFRLCMFLVAIMVILFAQDGGIYAQTVSPMAAPTITQPVTKLNGNAYAIGVYALPINAAENYLVPCDQGFCYGPPQFSLTQETIVAKKFQFLPYALYHLPGYWCNYACWNFSGRNTNSDLMKLTGPWKGDKS
jgi:hypothetical protein